MYGDGTMPTGVQDSKKWEKTWLEKRKAIEWMAKFNRSELVHDE
jgi:hypothetical protein